MSHDVYVLFGMVMVGFAVGITIDVLRALRIVCNFPHCIKDIIICLFLTILISFAFTYFNKTIIRGYEIIGLSLGVLLYYLTISRFLFNSFMFILKKILNFIKFIFKILLTPIRILYKMVYERFLLKRKKRIITSSGKKNEKD